MAHKYLDGEVCAPEVKEDIDDELISCVLSAKDKVEAYMNDCKIASALDVIFDIFRRSNKYIDETMPWVLAKDPEKLDRLKTVLYNLLESIRSGAVLLQAFLPETADKIFNQLNTENRFIDSLDFKGLDVGIHLNNPEPLFIRIDKEKKLQEIFE